MEQRLWSIAGKAIEKLQCKFLLAFFDIPYFLNFDPYFVFTKQYSDFKSFTYSTPVKFEQLKCNCWGWNWFWCVRELRRILNVSLSVSSELFLRVFFFQFLHHSSFQSSSSSEFVLEPLPSVLSLSAQFILRVLFKMFF